MRQFAHIRCSSDLILEVSVTLMKFSSCGYTAMWSEPEVLGLSWSEEEVIGCLDLKKKL